MEIEYEMFSNVVIPRVWEASGKIPKFKSMISFTAFTPIYFLQLVIVPNVMTGKTQNPSGERNLTNLTPWLASKAS